MGTNYTQFYAVSPCRIVVLLYGDSFKKSAVPPCRILVLLYGYSFHKHRSGGTLQFLYHLGYHRAGQFFSMLGHQVWWYLLASACWTLCSTAQSWWIIVPPVAVVGSWQRRP